MLRALCFSGKPCAACDGGTVAVEAAGGATGEASAAGSRAGGGGGGGGGGSLTDEAEAIFLNFLWRYFPSDSSQRCSTGSMAGTFKNGGRKSMLLSSQATEMAEMHCVCFGAVSIPQN